MLITYELQSNILYRCDLRLQVLSLVASRSVFAIWESSPLSLCWYHRYTMHRYLPIFSARSSRRERGERYHPNRFGNTPAEIGASDAGVSISSSAGDKAQSIAVSKESDMIYSEG